MSSSFSEPQYDHEPTTQEFDAKAFLKTVPNLPGCYRMYNQERVVIYVGKAKDLKKRLSSYFLKEQNAKTSALVSHIAFIEFTITFSETEALILENELIKKYQPHYNILLRDDKSYPYLLLTSAHEHPGLYFHRGPKRKQGDYFGPFPDSSAVKDSLKLMQKLFPIRQCEDTVYSHRSRPCLMAQIGKCLAPCVPMSQEQEQQYREQVDLIKLFLQGRNQELLSTIVQKMEEHAMAMEFEQAAALRDQLTTLRRVQESNSIISGIEYPVDIIGFALNEGVACIHVLFIRQGRIFGTRSFFPKVRDYDQTKEEIVLSFLCQFYLNEEHNNLIPDEVVVDFNAHYEHLLEQHSASDAQDEIDSQLDNKPSSTTQEHNELPYSDELTESNDLENLDSLEALEELSEQDLSKLNSQDQDHILSLEPPLSKEHWAYKKNRQKQRYSHSLALIDKEPRAQHHQDFSEDRVFIDKIKNQNLKATSANLSDNSTENTDMVSVLPHSELTDKSNGKLSDHGELELLKTAIKERFNKKVRFVKGARGAKKKYLQLAMANAQVALDAKLSSSATSEHRMKDLERLLGLKNIVRMECYDISHTMGELTVGSCVVFNREGPDSSRYRRYNIEGITPGDDFAAMHQVLQRRFKDPDNSECPQLIFIDGGPGQLKQAEEVLTKQFEQCTTPMPTIVAVAKGEGRKEGLETLIKAFSHERINLNLNSPALQLVIHIRDESHRFAITGHRNRRSKERRTSKLEAIAGIGPKRRQALLKHLGGMQEVLKASVAELQKVPGISPKMAQLIYDHLHA